MHPIQFYRQLRVWLHYRHAAFVSTREELEAALRTMPPRIVVDGDETLRAFAAGLLNGDEDVAAQPHADSTAFLIVSPVGRIRDGYRKPRKRPAVGKRLRGGLDFVLVTVIGLVAALITEWLCFPVEPKMIERHRAAHAGGKLASTPAAPLVPSSVHHPDWALWLAILFFGAIAAAAFAWVTWQALGLGRPVRTGWRLEYRVHGRLVMARVRRRAA